MAHELHIENTGRPRHMQLTRPASSECPPNAIAYPPVKPGAARVSERPRRNSNSLPHIQVQLCQFAISILEIYIFTPRVQCGSQTLRKKLANKKGNQPNYKHINVSMPRGGSHRIRGVTQLAGSMTRKMILVKLFFSYICVTRFAATINKRAENSQPHRPAIYCEPGRSFSWDMAFPLLTQAANHPRICAKRKATIITTPNFTSRRQSLSSALTPVSATSL